MDRAGSSPWGEARVSSGAERSESPSEEVRNGLNARAQGEREGGPCAETGQTQTLVGR